MSNPEFEGVDGGSTQAFVEDLFLTDCFLIKGRLANKYQRLARMLEEPDRTFVCIEDASMAALRGKEVIRTPRVLVNVREIVMAHELVDVAGDNAQRQLAANDKSVDVRAFYNGAVQLEIAGRIEPQAYDPRHGSRRHYFVMAEPRIRGLPFDDNPELEVLRKLPYAIVRRDKLAYIYDFS